ncbi:MAG TPA: hypothetical protein VLA03_07140, partial [Draconibacterium sp.]|nr:hypothetical protein [Draconibacterium sp.]
MNKNLLKISVFLFSFLFGICGYSKDVKSFKVIAFYTAKSDQGHISFGNEANNWFSKLSKKRQFNYDSTSDWNNMNSQFLSEYDVVIFIDS